MFAGSEGDVRYRGYSVPALSDLSAGPCLRRTAFNALFWLVFIRKKTFHIL